MAKRNSEGSLTSQLDAVTNPVNIIGITAANSEWIKITSIQASYSATVPHAVNDTSSFIRIGRVIVFLTDKPLSVDNIFIDPQPSVLPDFTDPASNWAKYIQSLDTERFLLDIQTYGGGVHSIFRDFSATDTPNGIYCPPSRTINIMQTCAYRTLDAPTAPTKHQGRISVTVRRVPMPSLSDNVTPQYLVFR